MTLSDFLFITQAIAQDIGQDTQEAMGQMDQASGQALWLTYKPLVAARWIHFASVFVLFGSSFF